MGFRTPSEINKELDAFDKRKQDEAEGQARLFGKKENTIREVLSPPEALPRIGAYVVDLLLLAFVMAIPYFVFSLLVVKIVTQFVPTPLFEILQSGMPDPSDKERLAEYHLAVQAMAQHAITITIATSGLWFLFSGLLYTLWFGFFHSTYGGSPGKLIFSLEVRDDFDETRTGYARAFFREFLGKGLSAALFFIGFFMGLLNKDQRALHDYLTGTKVVRVDRIEPERPLKNSSSPAMP